MKPHYFNQEAPDVDDSALMQAKQAKVVPEGCLLGGTIVSQIARANEDPCAWCGCPSRTRCGGRELKHKLDGDQLFKMPKLRTLTDDEAGARKLRRMALLSDLNKLMEE